MTSLVHVRLRQYPIAVGSATIKYMPKAVFHGQVNPLTGRAIFQTCSLPILLYGSKNWFITESLLGKLEAFQNEMGQRILRLPSCHSGRAVRLSLE